MLHKWIFENFTKGSDWIKAIKSTLNIHSPTPKANNSSNSGQNGGGMKYVIKPKKMKKTDNEP